MKVCLITGSTDGIGKATAFEMVARGYAVHLHGRTQEKSNAVAQEIRSRFPKAQVFPHACDLMSIGKVKVFAKELAQSLSRLDVLICNAGGFFSQDIKTAEGFESTWALNHLSMVVLVEALRDLLVKSAPSRVVIVSSATHESLRLDLEGLVRRQKFSLMKSYPHSKLANVMYCYALANRLAGLGVTVNCVHPGLVKTHIGKNNKGVFGFLTQVLQPLLFSGGIAPEKGAETSVFVATDETLRGVTGKYFKKSKEALSAKDSYDPSLQEELWRICEQQIHSVRL